MTMKMSSLPLAFATVLAPMAQGQSTPPQPKITGVLTILTPKPGVTVEQIIKIIPAEIPATVPLSPDGKIQGHGRTNFGGHDFHDLLDRNPRFWRKDRQHAGDLGLRWCGLTLRQGRQDRRERQQQVRHFHLHCSAPLIPRENIMFWYHWVPHTGDGTIRYQRCQGEGDGYRIEVKTPPERRRRNRGARAHP